MALAAALIAHGLIAAWLWPRAVRSDAAGAAPAAILIELSAPSAPAPSSTNPTSVPAPTTAAARPTAPKPPRRPAPEPPPPSATDAPRAIERPMQPAAVDAAAAPIAAETASPTSAPDEADAAAISSEAESTPASEPGPEPEPRTDASAVAAATTTARQRGSTQGRPAAEAAWQSRLLGHLEGFRRYPTRALRQRHEGVTYLRFSVDRHGRVGAVRLERGSGSDLLDAEALEVMRRAQPVPPPPPEIEGDPVEVVVPVQFRLRRR